MLAVLIYDDMFSWSDLQDYRNCPHFNLDPKVLEQASSNVNLVSKQFSLKPDSIKLEPVADDEVMVTRTLEM